MKNNFKKKAFLASGFIFTMPILPVLAMAMAPTNQEVAKASSEVTMLAAKFVDKETKVKDSTSSQDQYIYNKFPLNTTSDIANNKIYELPNIPVNITVTYNITQIDFANGWYQVVANIKDATSAVTKTFKITSFKPVSATSDNAILALVTMEVANKNQIETTLATKDKILLADILSNEKSFDKAKTLDSNGNAQWTIEFWASADKNERHYQLLGLTAPSAFFAHTNRPQIKYTLIASKGDYDWGKASLQIEIYYKDKNSENQNVIFYRQKFPFVGFKKSDDAQTLDSITSQDIESLINANKTKKASANAELEDGVISATNVNYTFTKWKVNDKAGTIAWIVKLTKGTLSKTLSATLSGFLKANQASVDAITASDLETSLNNLDKKKVASHIVNAKPTPGVLAINGVNYTFKSWNQDDETGEITWVVTLQKGDASKTLSGTFSGFFVSDANRIKQIIQSDSLANFSFNFIKKNFSHMIMSSASDLESLKLDDLDVIPSALNQDKILKLFKAILKFKVTNITDAQLTLLKLSDLELKPNYEIGELAITIQNHGNNKTNKVSDLKKKKPISEDERIVNDHLKVLDESYFSALQNHQVKALTITKTNVL